MHSDIGTVLLAVLLLRHLLYRLYRGKEVSRCHLYPLLLKNIRYRCVVDSACFGTGGVTLEGDSCCGSGHSRE